MVARLTFSVAAIVLADSPLACIRCATAAFDLASAFRRRHDLLDANESTWAFVDVDPVGCGGKPQVGLSRWRVRTVVESTADASRTFPVLINGLGGRSWAELVRAHFEELTILSYLGIDGRAPRQAVVW